MQRIVDALETKGVRYRSIVDAEFLKISGAIDRMQGDMRAGEEIRMVQPDDSAVQQSFGSGCSVDGDDILRVDGGGPRPTLCAGFSMSPNVIDRGRRWRAPRELRVSRQRFSSVRSPSQDRLRDPTDDHSKPFAKIESIEILATAMSPPTPLKPVTISCVPCRTVSPTMKVGLPNV
jgi:hypothetical protein